jgi:thiamine biosynthesis lipoprotein
MLLSRRRLLTIIAGTAMGASLTPTPATAQSWRGTALGAEAKIVIAGLAERDAGRMIELARAEIARLEAIFSLYRADSVLMRLNASGGIALPPPEMLALLSHVDAVHAGTGGMFDPTVQPLWDAYARHRGDLPASELEAGLALVGWRHVAFDTGAIRLNRAGMQLTLNGIAQGYVTDRVAQLLRREGLENAIIGIGEISALGHDSGGEPWRIGIASHGEGVAEDFVALSNMAVATSAANGTMFNGNLGHLLDPRSGLPARAFWKRVSVVHPSATIADGLSTAFGLMRRGDIRKALMSFPGAEVFAHDGRTPITVSASRDIRTNRHSTIKA